MSPIELRTQLIEAKKQFGRSEITVDQLHAAADAYIESLKEYRRVRKVKLTIPSRAYLIRAL